MLEQMTYMGGCTDSGSRAAATGTIQIEVQTRATKWRSGSLSHFPSVPLVNRVITYSLTYRELGVQALVPT